MTCRHLAGVVMVLWLLAISLPVLEGAVVKFFPMLLLKNVADVEEICRQCSQEWLSFHLVRFGE